MNRIDVPWNFLPFGPRKPDRKKADPKKRALFTDAVRKAEREQESPASERAAEIGAHPEAEQLEALLDDIHQIGEQLKENPNRERVVRYKDAVRAFLRKVVREGIAVEENSSGFNILKRKRFTLIRIVDEKLERLAAGVLRNQKDQLEILRRIDEIQGLLVDVMS